MRKESLIEMQHSLEINFPYLNCGGCGIFAFAYKNNCPEVELWQLSNFEDAGHFVISYKNLIFDGHGMVEDNGGLYEANSTGSVYTSAEEISLGDLAIKILDEEWNDAFIGDFNYNVWDAIKSLEEIIIKYI